MSRQIIPAEWANANPGGVVAPSASTQDNGYAAVKPPYQEHNWLFQLFSNMLQNAEQLGVMEWSPDTEYQQYGLTMSSDGNVYQAQIANDGNDPTTDDGTNWRTWRATGYLHVRDEKLSGTSGGNLSVGWNNRVVDTIKTNTIVGADTVSGLIRLPAGTYDLKCNSTVYQIGGGSNAGQARIYDTTAHAILLYGLTTSDGAGYGCPSPTITGRFSLTETSDLRLDQYAEDNINNGKGIASGNGNPEVYAEVEIWKLA